MKKKFLFAALIIALTGITTELSAQYADRSSEQQSSHHKRIGHGVKEGQLSRAEARRLRMREAKYRHDEQMAMRDGVITRAERRKLKKEERRNGMAIYRQKQDNNRY